MRKGEKTNKKRRKQTMTWEFDYDRINSWYTYPGENRNKLEENMHRALEQAKSYYRYEDDEDYVIIRVEGFYCITYVTDSFTPITICEIVFPFDEERIYPMQEIKLDVRFLTYREALSSPHLPPF